MAEARAVMHEVAPKLAELSADVLFGDVWERPGLSKRDRSLITVATLVALYRINEMPFHFKRALENGVTREELIEVITHLAFYSGWPTAGTAVSSVRRVFSEWGSLDGNAFLLWSEAVLAGASRPLKSVAGF